MDVLKKVKKDIEKNRLISNGDKVLVALSGGSDSVVLLHILNSLKNEIGFSLCAAHVNHSIREEADCDEIFVKNLCKCLGVECYSKKVDVLKISKEESKSSELCGRELRYEFFEELKEKYSIDKIATAHNKNDSAESIILHLIRGAGIDGLSGIPMIRDSYIIRPILSLSKTEVLKYLKDNKLSYVEDKTNFERMYSRNKVRLDLIPLIENELNEGFVETITSNAEIFREISSFVENYSNRVYNEIVKDGKVLAKDLFDNDVAVYKAVIQKMYKEISNSQQNLSNRYINNIIEVVGNAKGPKTINLPGEISLKYEQGFLCFVHNKDSVCDYEYPVILDEEIYIRECGYKIIVKYENEKKKNTKDKIYFYINDESRLCIRNKRKGDKFAPVGMDGTKNLSDLFCDMKLLRSKRDIAPILICDEKIVWVMGIRADRRFLEGKILVSCQILKGDLTDEKEC